MSDNGYLRMLQLRAPVAPDNASARSIEDFDDLLRRSYVDPDRAYAAFANDLQPQQQPLNNIQEEKPPRKKAGPSGERPKLKDLVSKHKHTIEEEAASLPPLENATAVETVEPLVLPTAKVSFAHDGHRKITPTKNYVADDKKAQKIKPAKRNSRRGSKRYSIAAQTTMCGKLCAVWRNVYKKLGLRHWLFISVLVAYAALGGLLFRWAEMENCRAKKINTNITLKEDRINLTARIVEIMQKPLVNLGSEEGVGTEKQRREKELIELLEEYQLNKTLFPKDMPTWDFWDGVFYSFTLFTTIGYGHFTPVTPFGQVCTILYALFGIPLVLAILADFGKLLTKDLKWGWSHVRLGIRRVLHIRRFSRLKAAAEKAGMNTDMEACISEAENVYDNDQVEFNFPIPLAVFLIVSWIFICSAIFCTWEKNWSYFNAIYFFFISLSTIGLGDVTPEHPKYMIANFPFVLIGLTLVSLVINLIQNKIEEFKIKAQSKFEDQLGLDTDTESECEQTEFEDDTEKEVDQQNRNDAHKAGDAGHASPATGQPAHKHKKPQQQFGRIALGVIQTIQTRKKRRRFGTQTEESYIRDHADGSMSAGVTPRSTGPSKRGLHADRQSITTGLSADSLYYDAA